MTSSRCCNGELKRDLEAAGLNLLVLPTSLKKLSKLLQKLERLLSMVDQDPPLDVQESLYPVMKALITQKLLWHPNLDIRVFVVSCLSEITRITAPDAPYDDAKMKEIFLVTRRALNKLYGASGNVVKKIASILHNIAKVRSCSFMLDLECDEMILEIFELFFGVIGSDLPQSVVLDMETIMTLVIEESHDISSNLLTCLLNSVRKETRESMPCSYELGKGILKRCSGKLKPCLLELVRSAEIPLNELPKIVSFICQDSLEEDPLVTQAYITSGKMAIKGVPRPSSKKRIRKPNSLMRPEEGYTLPTRSGEEEMGERNVKVSKRPLYINKEYGEEQVGRKIKVWWPSNKAFSEGPISAFDPLSMMHTFLHDNGEEEMLDLREERWEPI